MNALPDRSSLYVRPDGFVDVAKLIAAYSAEEHAERADRYFETIEDPWAHQLRKPFHDVNDSRALLAGLSAVLELGGIRPGDTVVDFGCGTGWLTVALSMMRCDAIGLDISAAALRIARDYAAVFPATRTNPVRFEVIDERLPLDDASADRIICFDAFHHVRDPEGALAEFARVLRPGGIAVFHEPGPRHSSTPVSQKEMREFAVIENDVVLERLWDAAQACGFASLRLAAFTERPIIMDLESYDARVHERASPEDYEQLGRRLMAQVYDKRVFSLQLPLAPGLNPETDSRARDALAGEIRLAAREADPAPGSLALRLEIANTGGAWWRPSGPRPGCVNLAARLIRPDGAVRDIRRFDISDQPTPAEERLAVRIAFALPGDLQADETLLLELVSEMVAWFSDVGSPGLQVSLS